MTIQEWLTLGMLVVSIITPLGTLAALFNRNRARASRDIMDSLKHLHDCFHRIELRMVALEAMTGRQEERDLKR